jgi:hypothetical protein
MSYMPELMPPPVHDRIVPDLARIESHAEALAYIKAMDFSWQKYKMVSDRFVIGWSMEKLDFVERQYKNMLYLWHKYPEENFSPPEEVDDFWHGHILDTRRYFNDTMRLYGRYLHHYPYFGMRGQDDRAALEQSFIQLQRVYRQEFGDWLRDWE